MVYFLRFFIILLPVLLICNCEKDVAFAPVDNIEEIEFYQFNISVTEQFPADNKIDMILKQINDGDTIIYSGRIERRGGGSMAFPKSSYEIDLEDDIPLGQLPEDDDWILNANYIDKTFMAELDTDSLMTCFVKWIPIMNHQNISMPRFN